QTPDPRFVDIAYPGHVRRVGGDAFEAGAVAAERRGISVGRDSPEPRVAGGMVVGEMNVPMPIDGKGLDALELCDIAWPVHLPSGQPRSGQCGRRPRRIRRDLADAEVRGVG